VRIKSSIIIELRVFYAHALCLLWPVRVVTNLMKLVEKF